MNRSAEHCSAGGDERLKAERRSALHVGSGGESVELGRPLILSPRERAGVRILPTRSARFEPLNRLAQERGRPCPQPPGQVPQASPPASDRGVPPRVRARGETPLELAGEDACGTTSATGGGRGRPGGGRFMERFHGPTTAAIAALEPGRSGNLRRGTKGNSQPVGVQVAAAGGTPAVRFMGRGKAGNGGSYQISLRSGMSHRFVHLGGLMAPTDTDCRLAFPGRPHG